jgi:CIC family chloride channel protein
VVVVDADDRYLGIAFPADAHGMGEVEGDLGGILHCEGRFLLPGMTVKEAVATFEAAEADALAVLDGEQSRHVLGLLTEQYALRRYNEELERKRRELAGEV